MSFWRVGSAGSSRARWGDYKSGGVLLAVSHVSFQVFLKSLTRSVGSSAAENWLGLLVIWALLSAVLVPRLLIGEIYVVNIDRLALNKGVGLVPLAPSSANLTQAGYALGGLFAFAAMRALLRQDPNLTTFRRAVLILTGLNITAALINLAEQYFGVSGFMEGIRNSGYAIMDGGEIHGLFRISGTFPETSTFSAFTLPLFAFCANLWRTQNCQYAAILALLSLALILLSTSSTAYVSLIGYIGCTIGIEIRGLIKREELPTLGSVSIGLWIVATVICVAAITAPDVLMEIGGFFQLTLVHKLESSSGIERSSWNLQAWQNFVETYGLGVGLGSARASSFPMVLLSNLGIIGTTLFLGFLWHVLFGVKLRAGVSTSTTIAARHAVLATLLAAAVSGTVFDIGLAFYAFAAAATIASSLLPIKPEEVRAARKYRLAKARWLR